MLIYPIATFAVIPDYELHLVDGEFEHSKFLRPMTNINGKVSFFENKGITDSLYFKINNSTFHLKGEFFLKMKKWDLIIKSVNLNPEDFITLLPKIKNFEPITPIIARLRFTRDKKLEKREFFFHVKEFNLSSTKIADGLKKIPCDNLYVKATDSSDNLNIEKLKFNLFKGELLYKQNTNKKNDTESFDAQLTNIDLKELMKYSETYKNKVYGKLTVKTIKKNKIISGYFKASAGYLQNLEFLKNLADRAKVKSLSKIFFSNISASFVQKKHFMEIKNFKLNSSIMDAEFDLNISGVDKKLKGRGFIRLKLKAFSSSRKLKHFGFLKGLMKRNTLKLRLRIGGTLDDPQIRTRI